jgi:NADH:ubiquinone oxidoreductase subunit 6 (subunit J)
MLISLLSLIIISSICVILSKNIIQSILYLILVFLLCSILFIYIGADFIGLIILIVYIGAISVLFLFIVMMLNIRILEIYSTFSIYLPLAFFLCLIFLIQISFIFFYSFNIIELNNLLIYINWISSTNIKINLIGQLLFNNYYILFIAATLLLFIAMIGVIILTLDKTNLNNKLNYTVKSNNINWKYFK